LSTSEKAATTMKMITAAVIHWPAVNLGSSNLDEFTLDRD